MNIAIASNEELDRYALRQERMQIPALPGDGSHEPKGLACAGTAGGRRQQRLVRNSRPRQVRHRPGSCHAHRRGQGVGTGAKVKRGAVLYVALERKQVVMRRAIAYRERHAIADIPFALIGGVFDLRTPQAVAALIEACRQVEAETGDDVVLIVIDTISRAMAGGDENSSRIWVQS